MKNEVTAYSVALRFVGIKEVPGIAANPQIVAMLQLVQPGLHNDDTAWCSAFVNYIAWLLGLPRSKSLAARSWLRIGDMVLPENARGINDVIIVKRGPDPQPGPDMIDAPGHVGFFAGWVDSGKKRVLILVGNQKSDGEVCIESFPSEWILGIRRLA